MSDERNPNPGAPRVSQMVDALSAVLSHRLEELDREIIQSTSEREVAALWRVRSIVRKVLRALCGHEQAK